MNIIEIVTNYLSFRWHVVQAIKIRQASHDRGNTIAGFFISDGGYAGAFFCDGISTGRGPFIHK
jgi:hypothetical protein